MTLEIKQLENSKQNCKSKTTFKMAFLSISWFSKIFGAYFKTIGFMKHTCFSSQSQTEENWNNQICESNVPAKTKCSLESQIVTKNQDVKICTPVMEKICPEKPCETCPLFCQAHSQIWCEDDFMVCKILNKSNYFEILKLYFKNKVCICLVMFLKFIIL